MISLLLAIIYLAFISLGLPDSLLGAGWPVMYMQLGVPISFAGIISMTIAGGTIISSLISDRVTLKFGAGLVTSVSVLMTAVALFGFSISSQFWQLVLWAIPYGLGAGAVDSALNNYIALNYSARHMSWLHCFWGVGVIISPNIMSWCLSSGRSWNSGYRTVSIIQIVITAILFISLPMWKKRKGNVKISGQKIKTKSLSQIFKIKGVPYVLISFFAYCSYETTTTLWASSYLVKARGINETTAASFASLFFIGITAGRLISGFIADKIGDKLMIRYGIVLSMLGILLILIPFSGNTFALIGLIITGFGSGPIYPSIIHATPTNFGAENSQAIIGVQMASAYTGSTFMPTIFGLIAQYININLFPLYLIFFASIVLIMTELLTKKSRG
jgi:fucose permease